MTQEEKAKAYDEVLKKARMFYKDEHVDNEVNSLLEVLFPELKESEDERMIQYFKDLAPFDKADELYEKYGFSHKDAIAWLEKQGKQKETLCDKCKKTQPSHSCQDITALGRCALEKQGEQKLTEFEKAVKQVMEEAIECGDTHNLKADAEMLLSLAHKSAWSEDDELYIRELESLVKQVWTTAEHENDKDTIHKMSDLSFFLKTLKPQPKQEWSEEDKKIIDRIESEFLALHRGEYKNIDFNNVDSLSVLNWVRKIKSLSFQSRWKPSDEQMDALRYVTNFDYGGYKATLVSLYEQLKKLRGE